MTGRTAAELAEWCADLSRRLHRDPRSVIDLSSPLIAELRRTPGPDVANEADVTDNLIPLARALAIRGRARRALGEIDLAEHDALDAVALADRLGDDELVADTRVALAGIRFFQARADESLRLLDEADIAARRSGKPAVAVASTLQRAMIDQQRGRVNEALAGYETARPILRALGARRDEAMVLLNIGSFLTGLGRPHDAAVVLEESRRLFAAEGLDYGVGQALHSLGWAAACEGRLRDALTALDQAVEQFARAGHDAREVDADRVEVLVAAGLVHEAVELGEDVARRLAAGGDVWWSADVRLMIARAAGAIGQFDRMRVHLAEAERIFSDQGAANRLLAVQVEEAEAGRGEPAELEALAAVCWSSGLTVAAVRALCSACRAALAVSDVAEAQRLLHDVRRRAGGVRLFDSDLAAASVGAEVAAAVGDRREAGRLVGAGLSMVRERQSSFAALDVGLTVSKTARRLAALGVGLAHSGGAWALLQAMERGRAHDVGAVTSAPGSIDESIGAALAELRELVTSIRATERTGGDTSAAHERQGDLERRIRRLHLRSSGSRPSQGRALQREELGHLGPLDVVELSWNGGCLVGVARSGGRLRQLPDRDAGAVRAATGRLASTLRTSALRFESANHERSASDPASALLRTLVPAGVGVEGLVLVVPPELSAVPWHSILAESVRFVVLAPSVTWLARRPSSVASHAAPNVVCLAGPGLRYAQPECEMVGESWSATAAASVVRIEPTATAPTALALLAEADIVHLAAHFRAHPTSPMWSSVELADGSLTLFDIEALPRAPRLAVLSACDSGGGAQVGEARLGLAHAMLTVGTEALVASLCPLPDHSATVAVMGALHHRLAAGSSPEVALADTSRSATSPEERVVASMLSVFGRPGVAYTRT